MKYSIAGTTMPVLQIQLNAGEKIIAEPGEFSWMSPNIGCDDADGRRADCSACWGERCRAAVFS